MRSSTRSPSRRRSRVRRKLLITSLEYSSYTGRIAVGKVTRGSLQAGENVTLAKRDGVTMQSARSGI